MLGWFKKKMKKGQTSAEVAPEMEHPLLENTPVQEDASPEPELDADLFTFIPPQEERDIKEFSPTRSILPPESPPEVVAEDGDEESEPVAEPTEETEELSAKDLPAGEERLELEPEPEPAPSGDVGTIEPIAVEEVPPEVPLVESEATQAEEQDQTVPSDPIQVVELEEPVSRPELKPDYEPESEPEDVTAKMINEPIMTEVEAAAPTAQEPAAEVKPPLPLSAVPGKSQQEKKKSLFSRLADRLARTRESFTYQLDTIFLGKKEIDAELLDDLEELLITADLGVATTQEILDHARRKLKRNELSDPNSLKRAIQEKIKSFIADYQEDAELVMPDEGPFVIMVVGVNGVGKTTTIGKVAHKFVQSNQSVLLVAADTFRAAAISQLKIWGERIKVPVIAQNEGSDPSSVVYDAIAHARAKDYDVVIVDTAGRLHTQANLMEELKKIKRVMNKQLEGAPHEVMLIIDATTGQNGISQAKLFNEAVGITGIALTKLDGTAKGGIVANICRELQTPIRFIGIGEKMDDLRDFDTDEFIEALFQKESGASQ